MRDGENYCLFLTFLFPEVITTVNKELNLIFPSTYFSFILLIFLSSSHHLSTIELANTVLRIAGEALTLSTQIGDAKLQIVYTDSETGYYYYFN